MAERTHEAQAVSATIVTGGVASCDPSQVRLRRVTATFVARRRTVCDGHKPRFPRDEIRRMTGETAQYSVCSEVICNGEKAGSVRQTDASMPRARMRHC